MRISIVPSPPSATGHTSSFRASPAPRAIARDTSRAEWVPLNLSGAISMLVGLPADEAARFPERTGRKLSLIAPDSVGPSPEIHLHSQRVSDDLAIGGRLQG